MVLVGAQKTHFVQKLKKPFGNIISIIAFSAFCVICSRQTVFETFWNPKQIFNGTVRLFIVIQRMQMHHT